MKNSKPICVIACIIALLVGFSALAQAQSGSGSKGKSPEQYYQCKDLRGNISLQQEPCSGVGVKQTAINLDGTPKTASDAAAPAAAGSMATGAEIAGNVSQDATAFINRYARFDKQQLMAKLESAKADNPFGLMVFFVLAILSLWHGLVLIYLAFSQSIWWGLGYLFVPLVGLVYVIMHWDDTKKPFLVNLFTGILAGLVAALYL